MPSLWGTTPRQSVEAACAADGAPAVVAKCVALLQGGEADDEFLLTIGGPAARAVLDGKAGGTSGYWPRTWAARALLYAWEDRATPAVLAAMDDDAWRVREMAAKVVARHRVDDAVEQLQRLRDDPVARVRAAALRAQRRLTGSTP